MPRGDICPECGTKLSQASWGSDLCPRCSLHLALEIDGVEIESTDSELEAPTLGYEAQTLTAGQILGGRYRIRALLGRGGMGEVWRAVDLKLRVEVALKALKAELLSDRKALAALRQEVRMAREVISPNVCRVFDLVELDDRELVSMEYIDGITLLDILKVRAPLDLSEAREIASQFLAGLEAIHDAGLIHRDVKPENIMMTRSGRVVLMDFGIAKDLGDRKVGTVSGTPAYMAPEQTRGEAPSARADVFSAGVVLAEMVAPGGLSTFEARQALWRSVHGEPLELPDSAWAPVIRKAVAAIAEQRFVSASALSRALEEVTLRADRSEDVTPYPGLASFSTEDAKFFFGRELEMEEMWKKLQRPHLLGLIGPSGAGKSSFLRAGLLAVTPTGWRVVIMTPGSRPFANLAQVLVPEVSGDTEALKLLVRADDSESLVEAVDAWRRKHDQVVLIVDQFEELFTQNPRDVQDRFSELLARLALEVDVRVLVSMRDDFLFHCSSQPALSPMFSELTPLRPPSGAALRRALVQPALKCGYRFEDESLVDEMVEEVSRERGALPMLAFAAARLWDHRDRDEGSLTREAYEHLGGVSGALAQHAERTLERIGQDRIPIVREIFRNLVTSQGTRIARTRDELLSVFRVAHEAPGSRSAARYLAGDAKPGAGERPDYVDQSIDRQSRHGGGTGAGQGSGTSLRDQSRPETLDHNRSSGDAATVLDALVDARLLTSYEVPAEDDKEAEQRIEIIHESLLSNWPRLVRWQAQDEDGALLRDQLRQAAQMWEERGHPEDLLWTGTSFNEFELWRERYGGGLTEAEQAFAAAMTSHAERRKRRRQVTLAGVIAALAIGLGIVGTFWHQATIARDRARVEQRRATGSQLLALGRLELETSNSGALAYALASLEYADDPVARRFVVETLWRGPPALVVDPGIAQSLDFSPDGRWLAAGYLDGSLKLWPRPGGDSTTLDPGEGPEQSVMQVRFGPDSTRLVSQDYGTNTIKIWSIPDGRLVRAITSDDRLDYRIAAESGRLITFSNRGDHTKIETWPLDEGEPEPYGSIEGDGLAKYALHPFPWNLSVDPIGSRVAFVPADDEGLFNYIHLLRMGSSTQRSGEILGPTPVRLSRIAFHPDGEHLAAASFDGGVRIWEGNESSGYTYRTLPPRPAYLARSLRFDRTGSRLAAAGWGGRAALWDLEGPPGANPLLVHRGESHFMLDLAIHPETSWLATTSDDLGVCLYPIDRRYPLKLDGHDGDIRGVVFLPDGSSIVTASSDGTLRLWPLSHRANQASRILLESSDFLVSVAVGSKGKYLLTKESSGPVWLVPIEDGSPRILSDQGGSLALGDHTAAIAVTRGKQNFLDLFDLESEERKSLELDGRALSLVFTPDERLIVGSDPGGIHIWDLETESAKSISDRGGFVDLSRDGRYLIASSQGENREAAIYDLVNETHQLLDSHGTALWAALDASGGTAVTVSSSEMRVGPVTGEAPHLLLSPETHLLPDISPDGQWIAAVDGTSTLTLWPTPDLSQPALHTLPTDKLLEKLRTLTNLRAVRDPDSDSGWRLDVDRFPGWQEMPSW